MIPDQGYHYAYESQDIINQGNLTTGVITRIHNYENYDGSRGFYYPFSKYTYGDIAKNNKELINLIKNSKVNKKKLQEIFDYFCGACDGKSTERVVKKLITED